MGKNPRYSVVISKRAKQMLGAHVRFLAKVSPEAAERTRIDLVRTIGTLAVFPERFPLFAEEHIPTGKYRGMFVEKWYLVLYRIKGEKVIVEYIIDCREDYEWLKG